MLEASWQQDEQFCTPNPSVYPHQWLWDSCFHAIAWAALADDRGLAELQSCFKAQLPSGFVPHMRYLRPNVARGPLTDRSSFTQPPIYAHAAAELQRRGWALPGPLVRAIERGLDWLWRARRTDDGLLYIVHPWESGADDSPRWDSWIGEERYNRRTYRRHDKRLVEQVVFDENGVATASAAFIAAPAAFNAFAAHAADELAFLTDSPEWAARSRSLAQAIDDVLWDESTGLWRDQPIIGGGPSAAIPTLDGVFGALVTEHGDRAKRALSQLTDDRRFGAEYGLAYLPPSHPSFRPNSYWRGPAWPQLNYMAYQAAKRWNDVSMMAYLAHATRRGVLQSGFAEFWNPRTGRGLGARPQGWAALAAALP